MTGLSSLPTLRATIAAHGLDARKGLGQHFILDAEILRRIVSYAGDLAGVTVIEIGPGPGGLTRALLESPARRVIAIEKDARCVPILEVLRAVSEDRLTIVQEDAFVHNALRHPAPRKIIANLPYQVGTALLLAWLDQIAHDPSAYVSMTLMFQKEVAERLVAPPGGKEYGRLSVFAQWLCDIRYDMELPPEAFHPPPKVSSALVTLVPRASPLFAVSRDALETVLAKAFGQRRKMLRAALRGLVPDPEKLLRTAEIDPTSRAAQVDLAGFGRLATAFTREKTAANTSESDAE